MDRNKVYLKVPEFTGENVPVAVAARVEKGSAVYPPGHHTWISEIRSGFQERGKLTI